MEICANCIKRDSCKELCETVEDQLKIKEPWNREEAPLIEVHLNTISEAKGDLSEYFAPEKPELSKQLLELAIEYLTKVQSDVFRLLIQGKRESEIASELSKSRSTIHTIIHGSSVGRGGIIRKLKKKCS